MSRNVTILIVVLVLVLLAGYLVWVRQRFQAPTSSPAPTPETTVTPSPTPEVTVSPTPTGTATPAATPKSATPAGRTVR